MQVAQYLNNKKNSFNKLDFLSLLFCMPFVGMLLLLMCEAGLAATGTALIIQAGHDVANGTFIVSDFLWIVLAQSASYIVGAMSWVFAERAGFGAFGRYLLRFTRENRNKADLLRSATQRESVEPFITSETFHIIFELIYELESDLKLFFGLIFNAFVLGYAVDAGLPWVYAAVFALLLTLQWVLRRPIANAYLEQQSATNRMTAHSFLAWNNIFVGNRYNFRIWHADFKQRLRQALQATIHAIVAREGLAAVSGVIALGMVFSYLAFIVAQGAHDTALLVALAATLPRQIELSSNVHRLASGWNDLLAIWTRMAGACAAINPASDADFDQRIQFDRLQISINKQVFNCTSVTDIVQNVMTMGCGRVLVRGLNGAGKSTLLTALKRELGAQAYYLPSTDKLTFQFAVFQGDFDNEEAKATSKTDFSTGEMQLRSLQEITLHTQCQAYLLDEWDANLDANNRALAEQCIQTLSARAVVVEISHRDSTHA